MATTTDERIKRVLGWLTFATLVLQAVQVIRALRPRRRHLATVTPLERTS
jgi:hypothetical protein